MKKIPGIKYCDLCEKPIFTIYTKTREGLEICNSCAIKNSHKKDKTFKISFHTEHV